MSMSLLALSGHKQASEASVIRVASYDDLLEAQAILETEESLNAELDEACRFSDGYPTEMPDEWSFGPPDNQDDTIRCTALDLNNLPGLRPAPIPEDLFAAVQAAQGREFYRVLDRIFGK